MAALQTTQRALAVGALTADLGTSARGALPAELGAATVEVPVTLVNGARPGPRVVITSGVHGGEFVGIAAAARLAAGLRPELVSGQLVISPVVNPPAAYGSRSAASPLDGVNLNRVFPGSPSVEADPTERLADWIFTRLLDGADAYVDLHSGGIDEGLTDFVGYRRTGDPALDSRTRDLARAVGYLDVIVGLDAEGGNSHAAAARRGIPALLIETGQLGERGDKAVERLLHGVRRLLQALGVLDGAPPEPAPPVREWAWACSVSAPAAGLWYPETAPGGDVTEGQLLGRIVDPASGRAHPVASPSSGRIFYGLHALTAPAGAELAAIAAPLRP